MMEKRYSSAESDDGDLFSCQDQTQIQSIRIQGPNISNINISKLPIGNNRWPQYAESLCDQRSHIRDKRDTSPMSVYSTTSMQHQNFQHTVDRGVMSFQQSMYNRRLGSSMSVRSFGSNVTLSALDVVEAFKNEHFNEHEWRIIQSAFKKYSKKKLSRKRIEKRRNKRLFLKGFRRRSGYDSGELGGESSESSDDARSLRTCREAIPANTSSSSCKSARTDCTNFRRPMPMSNLYKDCTGSLKQNAFRGLISSAPKYSQEKIYHHIQNGSIQRTQKFPIMSQKDRFGSGFLLPSQKFSQTIASSSIPEHPHKQNINGHSCTAKKNNNPAVNHQQESGSESDEIFSANFIGGNNISKPNTFQSKRSFNHVDNENHCLPQKKRNKLSSPQKRVGTNKKSQRQNEQKTDRKTCDFVFAKPQLPLRKPMVVKKSVKPVLTYDQSIQNDELSPPPTKTISQSNKIPANKPNTNTSNALVNLISTSNPPPQIIISSEPQPVEQLIAMSSRPLDDVMDPNSKQTLKSLPGNSPHDKDQTDQLESTQFSTTNTSMRPSFMKRKLFTQKADIAENKNASSDTIEENSPQSNVYSMIQKEKNRTRKLVTSQSCLNHDLGDESNLLDLIHKIVPANQMNLTSATNRTDITSNKSRTGNNTGNKWDVSVVLTKCKQDEESDTFTDEEIFNTNKTVIKSTMTYNSDSTQTHKPNQIAIKLKSPIKQVNLPEESKEAQKTRAVLNCVKSFWDSDEESGAENMKTPAKTTSNIVSSSKILSPPFSAKDWNVKNITYKSMCDVEKLTKKTSSKAKNLTISASNNSKQKKTDVPKPSPRKKQVQYAMTKQAGNSEKPAVMEKKTVPKSSPPKKQVPNAIMDQDCNSEKQATMEKKIVASKELKSKHEKSKLTNNLTSIATAKGKSENKALSQKKQVQNAKTKQDGISEKPATKEKKTVQDREVKNTQEKPKVNNLTLRVNIQKLNNTKATTYSDEETTFTCENDVYQKVVNKTLRIRACPKLPQCCDVHQKNNFVNDQMKLLTKSLRNREIDLSTTRSSGLDMTFKATPKRRGRPRKMDVITKVGKDKENISNLSDLSFTLTMEKTVVTRNRRLKNNGVLVDNRKRPSDFSFSLATDAKNLNKTGMTTRSAEKEMINVEVTKQKKMLIKSPLKLRKNKSRIR